MLNFNLNEQTTQRTSFDVLELNGYELPEEQLRFVAGGQRPGTKRRTYVPDCPYLTDVRLDPIGPGPGPGPGPVMQ